MQAYTIRKVFGINFKRPILPEHDYFESEHDYFESENDYFESQPEAFCVIKARAQYQKSATE